MVVEEMSEFKPQAKHWAFVGIVLAVVVCFSGFISFAELTKTQFIWTVIIGFLILSFVPIIAITCFTKDSNNLEHK